MAKGDTTANLIGYLGKATQWGREIWAPGESNGAIPVNIQDQHTPSFDVHFMKTLATPTTITAAVSPGDTTVNVTTTTGFADGVMIGISGNVAGSWYFGRQIGAISGNTVTLDTPIDRAYPAGAYVFPAAFRLNVDGSSTPQIYQIGPVGVASGIELDVTRIMGYIEDVEAMDDAKFGGLNALSKGLTLRISHNGEGHYTNVWNVHSNGEIGLLTFDASYTSKAPAGYNGYRFRNTYAGQDKHGVTLRLAPGETLEMLVQDNLTGLSDFQVMAQGHLVTD